MNKEENFIDIQNNDGYVEVDEINRIQQGYETFSAEESIKYLESSEEILEVNNLTNNIKTDTIKNVSSTTNASLSSQFFGAVTALASTAIIIGVAVGLIPTSKSFHVTNFLSRSNKLGFEITNDPDKTYEMVLYNDSYKKTLQLVDVSDFVFDELEPNTVYNLVIYDTTSGINKEVYSANYLTKTTDKYNANLAGLENDGNKIHMALNYEGNDIEYVTVEIFENGKSIMLYEGSKKEEFDFEVESVNSYFACKVAINGTMANYIEKGEKPKPKPTPSGDHYFAGWSYDDLTHWQWCIGHPECDGIKYDEAEHTFEMIEDNDEYSKYRCSVCGYEKIIEKEKEYIKYTLNDEGTGYILTGYSSYKEYVEGYNLVIPSEYKGLPVVEIADNAFYNNSYLSSVVVPNTVTKIGYGAFSCCWGLEELTLPFVGMEANHATLDETTFFGYIFGTYVDGSDVYGNLGEEFDVTSSDGSVETHYYVPRRIKKVTISDECIIYDSALRGFPLLEELYITGDVTAIPDYLIAYTNFGYFPSKLTKVYLPNTIESIGDYAFAYYEYLTQINYLGTMEEWNNVSLAPHWIEDSAVTKVVCSDGTITLG